MAVSASGRRLLTADRDEKIRVSCYPHTFEMEVGLYYYFIIFIITMTMMVMMMMMMMISLLFLL